MNLKKPVVFRRGDWNPETRMRELFDARLREEDTPLAHADAQQRKRRMFWSRLDGPHDAEVIAAAAPAEAYCLIWHRCRSYRSCSGKGTRHYRHQYPWRVDRGYRGCRHGIDAGRATADCRRQVARSGV